MKKEHYICTASIGSMTQAMKAQSVLSAVAIPSEIIKTQSANSRRGCVYGLSFSCAQQGNVSSLLKNNRISVLDMNRKNDLP